MFSPGVYCCLALDPWLAGGGEEKLVPGSEGETVPPMVWSGE